jgi:hypothetical protein
MLAPPRKQARRAGRPSAGRPWRFVQRSHAPQRRRDRFAPEALARRLRTALLLATQSGRRQGLLPAGETVDPKGEPFAQGDDVRVLGLDAGAASAATCAQREERENPTVIELVQPFHFRPEVFLPGLLVPLLDPGTKAVAATHDGWDVRHLHTGVELVLGVNELRQESVDLATIEDLIALPHDVEVRLYHRVIIEAGRTSGSRKAIASLVRRPADALDDEEQEWTVTALSLSESLWSGR